MRLTTTFSLPCRRLGYLSVALLGLLVLGGCVTGGPRAGAPAAGVAAWEQSAPLRDRYQPARVFYLGLSVNDTPERQNLECWEYSRELLGLALVRWLHVPPERCLQKTAPRLAELQQLFTRELPAQLGPDDLLVLYLGLHHETDGRLGLAGGDSIPSTQLAAWLARLPGRQLLLADVCYAQRLERQAGFGPQSARFYACEAAYRAPDVPLDGTDPGIAAYFADTRQLIQTELGIDHRAYSLAGICLVHALRLELQAGRDPLDLVALWQRYSATQREVRERATRRGNLLPAPASGNVNSWPLARLAPLAGGAPAEPAPEAASNPEPHQLAALLRQPDEQLDLARAFLLLGRVYEPKLAIEPYLQQLDRLAGELRSRLAGVEPPAQIVAIVNRFLFEEKGFVFVDDPYPQDFLLHSLLADKRGRCSSLTALYLTLGQRLQLPLEAVCLPGHIFVRYRLPDGGHLNIETTMGGAAFTDAELRQARGWSDTPRATAFYLHGLSSHQTLATYYGPLASALRAKGRFGEALAWARRAAALLPDDAETWNNLGMICARQQHLPEAARAYRQALAIAPEVAEFWNNLGSVEPNLDQQIVVFRKATVLQPDLGEVWFNLSQAYSRQGQAAAALDCARRAQQLGRKLPPDYLPQLEKAAQARNSGSP